MQFLLLRIALASAKFPALFKLALLTLGGLGSFAVAMVVDAPMQNPWFDATIVTWGLIVFGAIIKGEPEPDMITEIKAGRMTWSEFFYLWFYRSTHLAAISATAYMIHRNKWKHISGISDGGE